MVYDYWPVQAASTPLRRDLLRVAFVGLVLVAAVTVLASHAHADERGTRPTGTRAPRRLVDRFRSTELALAAYNAGPTAVERSGGAPTGQTLTYVANVMSIVQATWGCS